jgi:hypothetical protein
MSSWLFGSSSTVNNPPIPASALRFQTSMQGRPISIIWGTQRIAGNVIWMGDFAAIPLETSIGSNNFFTHIVTKAQTVTTGFDYTISVAFALCYGVVGSVIRAWNGTTETLSSSLGFSLYDGNLVQTAWTEPPLAQQLGYRGIAYVVQVSWNVGSNPALPIVNFEVASANTPLYGPDTADADPRDVVIDVLNNILYGVNFPTARIDPLLSQYSAYCLATGLIVSPIITDQITCATFLADLFAATNSGPRWSSGILSVVPWGTATITAGTVTTVTGEFHTIPNPSGGVLPSIQVAVQQFVSDLGVKYDSSGTPLTAISYSTFTALPNTSAWSATTTYAAGQTVTATNPNLGANQPFVLYISLINGNLNQQPALIPTAWLASTLIPGTYTVSPQGLYFFASGDAGANVDISYTEAATASYQPNITPVYDLTDDNFLPNQASIGAGTASDKEPVIYVRTRKSDKLNNIKSEYLDRSNNYDPVALDAKDEASIFEFGIRSSSLKTRHMFCLPAAAQLSAYLELIFNQISGKYMFTLGPSAILLDVEDIVTLTRPTMGMNKQPVRIIEMQENDDYSITFTAEEYLGTVSAALFGTQSSSGNNQNYLQVPGLVAAAIIFDPPTALATPPSGTIPIWIAVCGVDSVNYGGSFVWYSTDGVSFSNIGSVAPCNMGFNTADFPNHADPDNVNTLSVDLTESSGLLPAGSAANLALGLPSCLIGSEVIAYQNETLTSAFNYDLTTLRRGLYGTTPADQPIGSPFALLDNNLFKMTVPTAFSGQTVYFTFQPFNIYQSGQPDLSGLPVYPYVVGSTATITNRSITAETGYFSFTGPGAAVTHP